MNGIHLVMALGVIAVACGFPLEEQQGKNNLITGVFIPSDAFKNLQDRANANSPNNQQPIQGSVQGGQPSPNVQNPQSNYQPGASNQPQYQQYQPPVLTNQQPSQNNQQPGANNQPIVTVQQPGLNTQTPVLTNQPGNNNQMVSNMQPGNQQPIVFTQQPLTASRDPNTSNQPMMVMTNQPNGQSNPPIVFVQQPSSNQPIYVQQPNQQGNQGYVISNAQPSLPTQVIIATNPSNGNQIQGTLVSAPNQNQPGSTVYTLIPLDGQNNNNYNSGGSYMVPAQPGNSNQVILSTGK